MLHMTPKTRKQQAALPVVPLLLRAMVVTTSPQLVDLLLALLKDTALHLAPRHQDMAALLQQVVLLKGTEPRRLDTATALHKVPTALIRNRDTEHPLLGHHPGSNHMAVLNGDRHTGSSPMDIRPQGSPEDTRHHRTDTEPLRNKAL